MAARSDAGAAYFGTVQGRLAAKGFETATDAAYQGWTFALAARRGKVEASKMGLAQYYFVLDEFDALDPAGLDAFGSAAFTFSTQMGSSQSGLPRGFGRAVFVFAAAVLPSVDPALAKLVETKAGPKHYAGSELRVLADVGARQLHYLRKTPLWGAAYYRGHRKTIAETLDFPTTGAGGA
jgi:hypothetical protein